MSIEIDSSDEELQLYRVEGQLDAMGVQESRSEVEGGLARAVALHALDASELDLIDSSGIGFIVYMFKKVKAAGGHFGIVGINGQPQDMIRFLKLDKTVPVFAGLGELKDAYARRGSL